MSREIRRVPPDWQHPRNPNGDYKPLIDDYAGMLIDFQTHPEDWDGIPPSPEWYMPMFGDRATAYQVYESVSEGTPISPVFATEDKLREWLTTDGSGLGIGGRRMPLTPEQADSFIRSNFAPTMVYSNRTGLISGLEL